MKFSLLINKKMPSQLLLAFSYLLAEKISCSAELRMKKSFITSEPDCAEYIILHRKLRIHVVIYNIANNNVDN